MSHGSGTRPSRLNQPEHSSAACCMSTPTFCRACPRVCPNSHAASAAGNGQCLDELQQVITQQYDVMFTEDFDPTSIMFDLGNTAVPVASAAGFTSATGGLTDLFFRAHTDLSNGSSKFALTKSFLDNFQFSVNTVPEPASLGLSLAALLGWFLIPTVRRRALRCA